MLNSISLFFISIFFIFFNTAFSLTSGIKSSPEDSINVLHYSLKLDITNISGKKISGETEIQLTANYPKVYGIKLDLLKLSVDSVYLNSDPYPFSDNDTNIFIDFPQAITPQDTLILTVYYEGTPKIEPYGWGGFHFSSSYIAYNLGIALKESPPNYARTWFPCIDNFTEKAAYDFYITIDNSLFAVCNGNLISIVPLGSGKKEMHWQLSEEIPAYLASVAVYNYIAVTDTFVGINGPVPVYIYVKPSDSMKAVNSFVHLNQALSAFEDRFGAYRWCRVGYVSTALGAMEHATNIAYPTSCIDGTLAYETLYAHELGHSWFGNLVTCSSAPDMWINEGWASFTEGIFMEAVYGTTAFRNYMREKHHDVLKTTHHTDGGYFALTPIPANLTYGSTVYDKGAMVVHSLRGYLGSGLFFNTVKQYLDSFAFQSINSQELRDFFTAHSGVNLNDFFDTWVFNPGFPHFSIDSVNIIPSGNLYDVSVYIRQRLRGTSHVSDHNILELGFGKNNGTIEYDQITFSGLTSSKTFQLPFYPEWIGLDPNEKIADATTDNYQFVTTPGIVTFPQTYCSVEATQVPDTSMIRVIHNWVAPDPLPQPLPGLTLSSSRFWTIEGIIPAGFKAKGKFNYSKFGYLDNDIITNIKDSLVLLYRPGTTTAWQSIPFAMNGVPYQGELITDSLMIGEYTLAIWDHDFLGMAEPNSKKTMSISPNPASKMINICLYNKKPRQLRIFDNNGALVDTLSADAGEVQLHWIPATPCSGLYLIELTDTAEFVSERIKVIYMP
ncbi:MAG: M1 family aminopeptidase [Bacteroidales bacterium]